MSKEKIEQWYQENIKECDDSMSRRMLDEQYQRKIKLLEEGKDPFPENKTKNDDGIECIGCSA